MIRQELAEPVGREATGFSLTSTTPMVRFGPLDRLSAAAENTRREHRENATGPGKAWRDRDSVPGSRRVSEDRPVVGDIEAALDALNRAHVRYLVVGGIAVVLHGYLRTTADLDLVVQLERENVLRAMRALGELGYRPRAPVSAEALADPQMRDQWIREKGLTVFCVWSPARPTLEIDLFVSEPFDFDAVYSRALRVPLEKTEATVTALDDLIALKRQVGRPRDLEDIAALESLRNAEEQKDVPGDDQ